MPLALMPALLNSTSTRPKRASVAANSASTCAGCMTSVGTASSASPPPACATTCSSASARRPASTTRQPARASASAQDLPMPLPAPVTTATWFVGFMVEFTPVESLSFGGDPGVTPCPPPLGCAAAREVSI